MTNNHLALIVEDDGATAEDLAEILRSFDCDSITVDNKRDALAALERNAFCFVLLDLQIKREPDSIKGHFENGNALLREIRQRFSDHIGSSFWLPILIVSGFAREVDVAVEAMKNGASDVVHKPLVTGQVSETVRQALERSGRTFHSLCGTKPHMSRVKDGACVISIPGSRVKRRTQISVSGRIAELPDRLLTVLLRLMVAHLRGQQLHKVDLGYSGDKGFKAISLLREALKPVLGDGQNIIDNDYSGNYSLSKHVEIGICNADSLIAINHKPIADLAKELRGLLDSQART